MSLFSHKHPRLTFSFFFFNDTATTEIYTLSLHDALPISARTPSGFRSGKIESQARFGCRTRRTDSSAGPAGLLEQFCADRKSTRLNSSHGYISYAVFCLKKKKNKT